MLTILLALLCNASMSVLAQNTTEEVLPTFGDVIDILGAVSQPLPSLFISCTLALTF